MSKLKEGLIEGLYEKNTALARKIIAENQVRGSSPEAYSFIISGLQLLYPSISDDDLKNSITDDHGDAGIDAVYIDKDRKSIAIFDFKWGTGFGHADVRLFCENIKDCLFRRSDLSGLDIKVREKVRKVRALMSRGWELELYTVRGVSGKPPGKGTQKLIHSLKRLHSKIKSHEFLDKVLLVDKALSATSQINNYPWRVKVSDPGNEENRIIIRGKGPSGSIKSLIVRLRLVDVMKLYGDFIDRQLNLFDANVRDNKGNKPLSAGIVGTIKQDPDLFYVFHNGLTFSCLRISDINNSNYSIINPQIINGCQTVNAIYDHYKNRLKNQEFRKATILCRFYALDSRMIEKVCESTNTQAKIDLWDLRSNDDIQKIFEKALFAKSHDYARKITNRNRNKILITDLAQWIYSCIHAKPAEAKNNKAKLFDLFPNNPVYGKIFNERIDLDDLVTVSNIGLFVRNKVSRIPKAKLSFERAADLHFMAALYRLKGKNWTPNYKFRRVNTIIRDVIQKMLKHNKDLSYNKIFTKTGETWDLISNRIDRL